MKSTKTMGTMVPVILAVTIAVSAAAVTCCIVLPGVAYGAASPGQSMDGMDGTDEADRSNQVSEADAERLFREGNEAYAAKDFETAVKKFSGIVEAGIRDGAVEFNLANAWFRTGNLGRAILHYERAVRLLPRNSDVRQNLRIARKQTEDLAVEENTNAVVRFVRNLAFSLTANEWGVLSSLFLFLLGGVLVGRTLVRGETARRRLRHAAVVLAAAFLCSAGSVAAHWYRLRQPDAVILAPEVELYAEPAPQPGDRHLFLLHEGTVVRILRSEGDWVLVRYGPGMRGFCPRDALAEI